MKISVVLHDEASRPEAAYALGILLEACGLPWEITGAPLRGTVPLHYGAPPDPALRGVSITADPPQQWSYAEPDLAHVEGLPVVHTGPAPDALLTRREQGVQVGFDLVQAAFWLLSRKEEVESTKRDALGRFPCAENWLVRHNLAETPVVNLYAELLDRALTMAAALLGLPLLRKARWPGGRRYAVVLSHDVDDVGQHSPRDGLRLLRRALRQRSLRGVARGAALTGRGLAPWIGRRLHPCWNFEGITELEDAAGFRSTFYFVPRSQNAARDPAYEIADPRLRDVATRLRSGGWEVGAHGNFDSSLDAPSLREQRIELEQVVGSSVSGIRQHYLRLTVPDTFRAQVQAGYAYDSSLGFRAAAGFRAGTALPFHPYDSVASGPLPLVELPLAAMDSALAPTEAAERVQALLQTVAKYGGLAVLLWHQRVPYATKYPGWWPVYRTILEHLREDGRAWVATASEVARWWLARKSICLESVLVEDKLWRWRFRADKAISGLVLELSGVEQAGLSVTGAQATVCPEGNGLCRIELGPLASGQGFEIAL